ncbi:hypothetical protein J0B03_09330 [Alkalibacter rhizosphaerae]|uniref:Uncharacterized protein n=1 Tax=Alkalibacter rhizosphaerae TaxID=2815577 RepID=A0A974XG40_9FIRM|nr:hypothetical protein [Alkalibacter rhizosphaerae]QSX08000.1 hypothetical protein J0B03_09330 [Alkalibacter rhizosphaerae]
METERRTREIEEYINRIQSVINSRVVMDSNEQIIEIHILANSTRAAKQITRDVQSVLMAGLDMPVDHKVISVAQVYDEDALTIPRLTIQSVEYATSAMEAKAKVVLEFNGALYEGIAYGVKTSNQCHRTVAQATLEAVESFLEKTLKFVVEEIKTVPMASKEVVVSGISLIQNNSEKLLIGKCIVDSDLHSAITKSVLDAINRTIQIV